VSLAESQVRDRTKTVTRRTEWRTLRPGDQLTLCRKVMARRPGDPLERIATVEVTSVRREPLDAARTQEKTEEEREPDDGKRTPNPSGRLLPGTS
jgi:hypothetical protein